MNTASDYQAKKRRPARQTSLATFLLSLCLVALIGYVLGTRNREIMSRVGPLFGVTTDASRLDLSMATQVFHLLKENYDGSIDTAKLEDGAVSGLTAALGDKYTVFLDKSDAADFQNSLDGKVSGVGAEIGTRGSQPTILRVIDGSPAKSAGLKVGDQITMVNTTTAIGKSPDAVANLIRGEAGTSVKVTIKRSDGTHIYSITRASVTDPSVASRLEGSVGILTVRRFDDTTGDLAARAASKLKSEGARSIILDLRDDGGGELDQTKSLAGLWLDDNQTVVTVKKGDKVKETLKADGDQTLKGVPTIVLTNGNTASAAEIVTGALHDYGAATILGEKTYGKGSVQQVFTLADGAELKVTIARWYTPRDKNINGSGFEPDIKVTLSSEDTNAGRDPQLAAALKKLAG